MGLRINGSADRSAGCIDVLCKDFLSVTGDMDCLSAVAGRNKAHGQQRRSVSGNSAEIPCQAVARDRNGPCKGFGVTIGVLNGQLNAVCRRRDEVLCDVKGDVALLDALCSYLRAIHAPDSGAVAGGRSIFAIQRGPVAIHNNLIALFCAEGTGRHVIYDTDCGPCAATAGAVARERTQGTGYNLVFRGKIQIAVLNVGVVHLTVQNGFHAVKILCKFIYRGNSFSCVH